MPKEVLVALQILESVGVDIPITNFRVEKSRGCFHYRLFKGLFIHLKKSKPGLTDYKSFILKGVLQ